MQFPNNDELKGISWLRHFLLPMSQSPLDEHEIKAAHLKNPEGTTSVRIVGYWCDINALQPTMMLNPALVPLIKNCKTMVAEITSCCPKGMEDKLQLDSEGFGLVPSDAKFVHQKNADYVYAALVRPERDWKNKGYLRVYSPMPTAILAKEPPGTWLTHECQIEHLIFVTVNKQLVPADRVYQVTWKTVSGFDSIIVGKTSCWGWYEIKKLNDIVDVVASLAFHPTLHCILDKRIPDFDKSKMYELPDWIERYVQNEVRIALASSSPAVVVGADAASGVVVSVSSTPSNPFLPRQVVDSIPREHHEVINLIATTLESLTETFLSKEINEKQTFDIATRLRGDLKLQDEFMRVIYATRSCRTLARAASNTITALNVAGRGFSGCDFSGVCIPNAKLNHGVFQKTVFQGADLTGVKFFQSYLEGAIFDGALMKNVDLGEYPSVKLMNPPNCVAVSKNGQLIVVGTWSGQLQFFNWPNITEIKPYQVRGEIHGISISSDNRYLACVFGKRDVVVLYIENLFAVKKIWNKTLSCADVVSVAFSPSVKQLAIMCHAQVNVYTILENSDEKEWCQHQYASERVSKELTAMLWLSEYVFVTCGKSQQVLMHIKKEAAPFNLGEHKMRFCAMARSNDLLALCGVQSGRGNPNELWIYNVTDRKIIKMIDTGHTADITSVCFVPEEDCIVTASADFTTKVWSMAPDKKEAITTFMGPKSQVRGVAALPGSKMIVTIYLDWHMRFWSLEGMQPMRLQVHPTRVNKVMVFPDGLSILSSSQDGFLFEWGIRTCEKKQAYKCDGNILDFSLGHNEEFVSLDTESIKFWKRNVTQPLRNIPLTDLTLPSEIMSIKTVQFLSRSNLLITASPLGSIGSTVVWRVTPKELERVHVYPLPVSCMTLTNDQKCVFMGTMQGYVLAMFPPGFIKPFDITSAEGRIMSLNISNDNKVLTVAGRNSYETRVVYLEDKQDDTRVRQFKHKEFCPTTAIHPTSQFIVCGMEDGSLSFLRLKDNRYLFFVRAHAGIITSLSFSPDGNLLVSGGVDAAIKVWDVTPVLREDTSIPILVWSSHSLLNVFNVSIKDTQELPPRTRKLIESFRDLPIEKVSYLV